MGDLNITSSSSNSFINPSYDSSTNISNAGFNEEKNTLIAKANVLGIDVSAFYTNNAQTGETSLDTQKLSVAIQEATKQKTRNLDSDSFVKTADGSTYTKEEAKNAANSNKDSISSEYKANVKYINNVETDFQASNEEEALVEKWNSIESEANALTSVTASNTTVLEGVKEFIKNLNDLVNETKRFDGDTKEEAAVDSSMTDENIFAEANSIHVYESEDESNTLGNNPFFNSAFNTFEYEEEKEAV